MQLYHHANVSEVDSFELTLMAPKGTTKGNGMTTAKMQTPVINRSLSLDREHLKGFILEHIHGLILINNVCIINNERAWDFF